VPAPTSPLTATLLADPTSVEARLVYADWLQAQGDPRGELIALELRLAEAGQDPAVVERAQELSRSIEARLLEGWPPESVTLEWRLGFVRAVRSRGRPWSGLAEKLGPLLEDAALLLLEEVDLVESWPRSTGQQQLAERLRSSLPRGLRALRIGLAGHAKQEVVQPVSALLGSLPALESLSIRLLNKPVRPGSLGGLAGLRLRSFELAAPSWPGAPGWLGRDWVEALLALDWPELGCLLLHLGQRNANLGDGAVRLIHLAPMLEGRAFPRLDALGAFDAGPALTRELIGDLPTRPLFARLRRLGFSFAELDEGGFAALRERVEQYRPLELFDASSTRIAYAHHQRGRVLQDIFERPAAALEEHRAALQKLAGDAPDRWRYLREAGDAAADACRWQDALATLDEALALSAGQPWIWFRRGQVLRALGRLDDALASLRTALERQDQPARRASTLNQVALCHVQKEEPGEALAALEQARSLSQASYLLANQAEVLFRLGRLHEVVPEVEQALAAADLEPSQRARLAWALLRAGRAEEALSHFDRVQASRGLLGSGLQGLAAALCAAHREAEALACYDRLIVEADCPAELSLALLAQGCLLLSSEQGQAARERFERAGGGAAVEPGAIAAALSAYGEVGRGAGATVVHGPLEDLHQWHVDLGGCSALAVLAALLLGDRPLARRRLEALRELVRPGHLAVRWDSLEDLLQRATPSLSASDAAWARIAVGIATLQVPRSRLDELLSV